MKESTEILRRRGRFLLFLLLYPVLPVAVVVNLCWLFRLPRDLSDTLFFAMMAPEGIAFVLLAVFLHRCRCPSCGERFFLRKTSIGLTYGNAFARRCLNCGTPEQRDDDNAS